MSAVTGQRIVAVTGATGFVGAETVERLLAGGFTIHALTRRPREPRDGVTWIGGTLSEPDALDALVRGTDVILHIAGVVNAPSRAAFETGNATGTANLVAAMKRAGGRRLVHVSSLAARERDLSDYCWSKSLAEDHVRSSGLDWTIVRPPAVYGPRDTEFREILRVARRGFLPVPQAGRASLIHVRDLARLLVALCGKAGGVHTGQLWEIDDGTPGGFSHPELAAEIGRALRRPVRAVPVAPAILRGVAWMDRLVRGDGAKLTADRVRYLCHTDWVADPSKRPPADFWRPEIDTAAGLGEIAEEFR